MYSILAPKLLGEERQGGRVSEIEGLGNWGRKGRRDGERKRELTIGKLLATSGLSTDIVATVFHLDICFPDYVNMWKAESSKIRK